MATGTYTQIANITLSGTASSITFSNISQDYTDLILVTRHTHAANYGLIGLRFNSDSASNYYYVLMSGMSWNAPYSYANSSGDSFMAVNQTGTDTGAVLMSVTNIFDYSKTDKQKTALSRLSGFSGDTWSNAITARWASTNAVTSITVGNWAGTYTQGFAAGSTFALYGVVS